MVTSPRRPIPPDDDDGVGSLADLLPDEIEGGRRRLRRAIIVGAVFAIAVLLAGVVTLMR